MFSFNFKKIMQTSFSCMILFTSPWSSVALGKDVQQTLIGGTPADITKYPASIYISASGSRCTATVVGARVVYTAAHCVSNGGTITFSVGANNYSGSCTHHQSYRGNSTADWALCAINKDVTGITYENVNVDPSIIAVGKTVELTGYGCTRNGGGGGNDGTYRIGNAVITDTPSGTNYDIVTEKGAALCFGDSGGPAFMYLDEAKTERVLISINSRGDIATTSYLSSVSADTAVKWATDWANSKQLAICGITSGAQGCRANGNNPEPGPIAPPDSKECEAMVAAKSLEKWNACNASETKPAKVECEAALSSIGACYLTRYPRI